MDIELVINKSISDIISLYLPDYRKELYGREISVLLKANHRTILLNLNKLIIANIMKSRIRGKHRYFSLNADNLLAKFYIAEAENYQRLNYLKKNFLVKKLLSELKDINDGLVLFGSYVKGYHTKTSDIDLLVIGKLSKKEEKEIQTVGKRYDKQIQIFAITANQFKNNLRKGAIVYKEVVKNHIILKNIDLFIDILWEYYNEIR